MIEWLMFGALGFFLGCLLGLMLAPPLWNRAVKLTTRRLEATMPMTLADIQADKDQLRADFAIQLRKVEVALDKSKEKAARELIEANKRRVEIQQLNDNLESAKGELQEAENANRVLQQTIKRRLPDLNARLNAAKKALSELETVNAELRNTVASQSEALKIARSTVNNQRADIDRLRLSLESGSAAGRGSSKSDSKAVAESQRLAAELSRAQEELERTRISNEEIAFLRRELNQLASHIMDTARTHPPLQAASLISPLGAHNEPEAAEENYESEEDYAADEEMAAQQVQAEQDWAAQHKATAYAGNGAAQPAVDEEAETEPTGEVYAEQEYAEPEDETSYEAGHEAPDEEVYEKKTYEIDEPYETYELEHAHGASDDEPLEDDFDDEAEKAEEKKVSFSQRFAARRAKRRAEKSGGGSLTSRLRGLVADAPETRG